MKNIRDKPLIAVTGGAGFIGSHTVDLLVERGCQVVVLDNFSTGKSKNLARWQNDHRVEVARVDISKGVFAALAAVTARRGPVERIVHLAAQTSVAYSIDNPLVDIQVNYAGTVHILEYARTMAVQHVVFASSAAVYGDVAKLPVHESAPTAPVSPYGINKRACELMLSYYSKVQGIATTALRFFNVYGPRQDPSSPYSGVISLFAERALTDQPLTIFGDGEQTRDFIYVGDICRAIVGVSLSDRQGFAVCNLGTGSETPINQLAALIIERCGSSSRILHTQPRVGEIRRSVAAIIRARELLGDSHPVAEVSIGSGLSHTLEWLREDSCAVATTAARANRD